MARTFTDLTAELQSMLAETGQSNDFWTSTDLGKYVNAGLRVVSVYGRYEFVKGLEYSDNSLTIETNKAHLPADFLRFSEPLRVIVDDVEVGVLTSPEDLRVYQYNEFQKPSTENIYIVPSNKALYIYPAPTEVELFYIKEQPVISGATEPTITEEGVDYALKYAFGMALCKGGLNVSAGMQLMQQVRQEIR